MNELIAETVQTFDPGKIVTLFQLDATILGGPIYYFTSCTVDGGFISWNGDDYTPIDIEAEGFEWNGQGVLPTPKIRISNINKVASAAVIEFGDLLGSVLTRIRTFEQFLDGQVDADPTAIFPLDIYKVERKTAHNKAFVEWELSAAIDQEGRRLPGRQFLRDACTQTYRRYVSGSFDYSNASCPYAGTTYINRQGVTVTDPSLDDCGRRLSDCRKRFGVSGELPTRAFPGIGKVS